MYVLYDIKYLLSAVPLPEILEGAVTDLPLADDNDSTSGRWNEPLRKGFLHGFDKLLSLLASMEVCHCVQRVRNLVFKCGAISRAWTAWLAKRVSTSNSKRNGKRHLIYTASWRRC